jgi:hypothetical protein
MDMHLLESVHDEILEEAQILEAVLELEEFIYELLEEGYEYEDIEDYLIQEGLGGLLQFVKNRAGAHGRALTDFGRSPILNRMRGNPQLTGKTAGTGKRVGSIRTTQTLKGVRSGAANLGSPAKPKVPAFARGNSKMGQVVRRSNQNYRPTQTSGKPFPSMPKPIQGGRAGQPKKRRLRRANPFGAGALYMNRKVA